MPKKGEIWHKYTFSTPITRLDSCSQVDFAISLLSAQKHDKASHQLLPLPLLLLLLLFSFSFSERWLSGRKRHPAKMLYPHKGYRGFESLSLRKKASLFVRLFLFLGGIFIDTTVLKLKQIPNDVVIYVLRSVLLVSMLAVLSVSCTVSDNVQYLQTITEEDYQNLIGVRGRDGIDEAQRRVDSIYAAVKKPSPVEYWRKRVFDAYLSNEKRDFDRSLEIVDSLISYIEFSEHKSNMLNELALTYLYKGDIFNNYLYQNNRAYTYYVRARTIGLNLDDRCLISRYDSRFAGVLYRRQNYLDAAEYFKKSIVALDDCDTEVAHFTRMQRRLDDIAISYARAGVFDSAMVYHKKAIDYIHTNRFSVEVDSAFIEVALGVIYGNMAQSFVLLGEPSRAEPLFERSIEFNSLPDRDNNDASLSRIHLAKLYMNRGDIIGADSLLKQVEDYVSQFPNPDTIIRLLDARSRLYHLRGEYRLALEDRLLHNHKDDSLKQVNLMMFNTEASNEYNYTLAQKELERLRADSEIRTLWLYGISIVISLFIVVLLIIYFAWRQLMKSHIMLSELNDQVNTQKRELEFTVQQLKESSVEKDRIMWMVAHDLRNPLGAIQNLTQLLQHDSISDGNQEIVNQISFATTSAQRFIGDILTLADEDRIKIDARSTDINELLFRIVEMMQFRAKEKGQSLVYYGLGKEKVIRIDPEKITRAVFNLIGNAVKFSPKGSDVVVSAVDDNEKIEIMVVDKGIGVPADMRETIFDSFTKAKRSGTSGEKPYGLGLSIARSIVNAHGGRIVMRDNPSGGSIFTIELPLLQ
jgi:two-component system, OmpR family, sensor histidine kinase VicK